MAVPVRHDVRRFEVGRQLVLIVLASVVYFGVRFITEGSYASAVSNARDILDAERAFGLDIEAGMQSFVTDHRMLTTLANWIYIWIHWPLIALTFICLYRWRRAEFYLLRNAMFVSGAIGIVIFALFPVAPPRLLPGSPYVDTVTKLSNSYRVLQPPSLINKYAAMPSFHVGWNLLVGIALYRSTGSRLLRAVGVTCPVLMTLAVVATANHYLLDPLVGCSIALVAFWVSWRLAARSRATRMGLPATAPLEQPH